ncbi:MAG: TetR/AcrR family transcriptional regulator [Candidatus Sericytochromatia bacterium]|nr:TetR/AcrR family transcriptional regulator [Candidatus Sericytochromatia bacterium]
MDDTPHLVESLYQRLKRELADRPFQTFSMAELASLIDQPLGELFRLFPTKDELGQAMIGLACDDVYRNFDNEVDASAPLKDRLLAFLSLQLEFLGPWRTIFENQIGNLFLPMSGMSRTALRNVSRYNAFLTALLGADAPDADWRLRLTTPALVGSFGIFNASVWVRWRFDQAADKAATLVYIHQGLDTYLKGLKAWHVRV